jgi:hypothetical protein
MPNTPHRLWRAKIWQERAVAARLEAETVHEMDSKVMLWGIGVIYEDMAKRAEKEALEDRDQWHWRSRAALNHNRWRRKNGQEIRTAFCRGSLARWMRH